MIHRPPNPARLHRRGTIYVLVLVSAMIVTVVGVIGIAIVRQDLARSELNLSAAKATVYAQSAIELGLTEINSNTSWRSTWTNAGTVFSRTIGDGSMSLTISDPADSNLANSASDTFLMHAVGTRGFATQIIEVKVVPTLPPLPALSCCLTVGGTTTFTSAKVRNLSPIASVGNVSASSSTISGNVQSAGTITGSNYSGTRTAGAAAPSLPARATVVAYYASLATTINYASLSSGVLQNVVLTDARNPFGSVNSQGIYVINCASQDMTIRNCRINGTLVIRNARTVTISNSNLLQTTSPSLPVLIIDGNADVSTSSSDLSESLLINFNPSGAPYLGVTDIDTSDNYPSQIQGIVGVFGNLTVQSGANLNVVGPILVTGNAALQGSLMLTGDASTATTPAYGFTATPTYAFDDTTWKRAVN